MMETHLTNIFHNAYTKWMWLCTMGWDNLTNQRTDLVAQHLKLWLVFSEMPEQSLSSKYFSIIVYNLTCVPKQQASTSEKNDRYELCFICLLWGTSNSSYRKMIILSGFSYFSWWYIVAVYQELFFLWLVGWKQCFIRKCLMLYSSFVH